MEPKITQPNLDAMKPIGNGINAPQYQNSDTNIIATKSVDMTNSGTNLNQSASSVNLSAKYKNPQKKQDTGITYSDQ
jgi:hypothetical protein